MSHSVYVILYFFFFLVFFSAITIFVQENSFTIHLLAKMAIHTIDTLGIFHFGQEKRGAGTRVPIRREKKFHFVCMWLRSTWLSLAGVRAFYLSLSLTILSLGWLDCLRRFNCKIKLKGTLIPPKCLKHINFQSSNIFVKYLHSNRAFVYVCGSV